MIYIKDLEEYFNKDFETIIKDNDIVYIANNVENATKNFVDYEREKYNNYVSIETIFAMCYWLENATKQELFNRELDTCERYFKIVENGNIYYLNNIE